MSDSQKIVQNLKGRVHAVNAMAACAGTSDFMKAMSCLRKLIKDGIVRSETIRLPDGNSGTLYRYNQFREGLTASPKPYIIASN